MIRLLVLAACLLLPGEALEAKSYVPIGEGRGDAAHTGRQSRLIDPDARPALPGLRPVEVELLEDALRRKHPKRIGASSERARESIVRNALRDPVKRAHIKGVLAEALFLEQNPEWGYVRSPTAQQVDVYRWLPDRTRPLGAQIKTHSSADPLVYARDMVTDHKADIFLVPDDHVERLREHWRGQAQRHRAEGRIGAAVEAERQLTRVRSVGFTAKELDDRFERAARHCIRERNARYVSLASGVALALGPALSEWFRTGTLSEQSGMDVGRVVLLLGSERGIAYGLARVRGGALQGTLRGNVITGVGLLTIDTGLSVYESGGVVAFQNAEFYARLGGGVSSLAVGLMAASTAGVYATIAAAPAGTLAPFIGAATGLVTGVVAGAGAYVGGDAATRAILEVVDPAFLHNAETAAFLAAREGLDASIARLSDDSTPSRDPKPQ